MNQNQSISHNPSRKRRTRFGSLFQSTSLRNRLLLAFILLALLPVLITGTAASIISTQGLKNEVLSQLDAIASLKETEINTLLDVLQTNLNLISEDQVTQQSIITLLQNTSEEGVSDAQLRNDLINFSKKTGYFIELFIINKDGKIVLSTDPTQEEKIQANQAFFSQGLLGQYIAPPTYEVALANYSIVISEPIKSRTGTTIGVLAGRIDLSTLNKIMQERGGLGAAVETYLVSANYAALTTLQHGEFTLGESYVRTQGATNAIQTKTAGSDSYVDYAGNATFGSYRWIPELQLAVIVEHDQAEALQPSSRVLQTTIALILVTVLAAIFVAFIVTRGITAPITKLVNIAENIAQGNLELQAEVSGDEIGVLATAFNTMSNRLRELIGTLEQRVADRTKALETSTEVSRRLSTILDRKELVAEVVNQVRNAFGYYHTQIYFYDEARENLVMAGGTGEAGRIMLEQFHKLAKGRGLVGRAAENNKTILVTDTTNNPEWLPNPLLPETKSEAVIPISIGDLVLGVLDVQHNIVDGLKREDMDALLSIANQVAIAAQNAQSYTEIQRSQALLSDALKAARLGNWEYDFENDLFHFSDEFYAIFRTSAEKVGGYKISSADYAKHFVHPDDAPLVGTEIQKVLDAKDRLFTTHLEHRIIFSDGEVGYIAVNINVERDGNGKILRWYGANQDITERRRLEEFNRKRAQYQEAINSITQKIQSATTIETALQVTARELGHALGMKPTLVALDAKDFTDLS
ncbi:MAG: GAF domain-containing protein [Anaerolineales bacterium]|nr:GAF domain-containing protein [Anaerolineales bacterium]